VPRTAAVIDRCVCSTPLGEPVDPLVNSSQATSSGPAPSSPGEWFCTSSHSNDPKRIAGAFVAGSASR
jgi:hypothetical protein